MREYEMMILLEAESSKEDRDAVYTSIKDQLKADKATWVDGDDWGRKQLAYEINHQDHAHYYLAKFDCTPDTLDEIVRKLRINDTVVRVLAVDRVDEESVERMATVEVRKIKDRKERGRGRGRD